MADTEDIRIVRGEPFSQIIEADLIQGGDFDLSDYSMEGGIRFKYTEPNLADFTVNVTNPPTSGLMTMSLTANQTRGLPVTQCIYYLKAIHSGDAVPIDLLKGYANIYPL